MSKATPKHKEIEYDLLAQIRSGHLKTGDQLMTENELSEHYKVSRMTARKALESLASQGIVQRTAGKGTFVNSIHVRKTADTVTSFSDDIRSVGMVPGSILAEYRIQSASEIPEVAGELQLKPDELIHCICRIRTADNIKVALNYTYIPFSIIPNMEIRMLEGSIYEYIKNIYEIAPFTGAKTITAVMATNEQKRLLEINEEALLEIRHPGYLMDGRPFEYTITYYICSRIIYTNTSNTGKGSYKMLPSAVSTSM